MRKSRTETAETRRRIVETAAGEFRRNGIGATGLAELMARAGLTHGGFYRHFDSKEQLIGEACCTAVAGITQALEQTTHNKPSRAALKAAATAYLSAEHRDNPESGCPLAALGSELARADAKTKAVATAGFVRLVDLIGSQFAGKRPDAARNLALSAVSLMIGALTMARVVDDSGLSSEILRQAGRQVQRMAS